MAEIPIISTETDLNVMHFFWILWQDNFCHTKEIKCMSKYHHSGAYLFIEDIVVRREKNWTHLILLFEIRWNEFDDCNSKWNEKWPWRFNQNDKLSSFHMTRKENCALIMDLTKHNCIYYFTVSTHTQHTTLMCNI